jgi:hypothetical protein
MTWRIRIRPYLDAISLASDSDVADRGVVVNYLIIKPTPCLRPAPRGTHSKRKRYKKQE